MNEEIAELLKAEGFVFIDLPRRTFVVQSRSGGNYHLIHAADEQDRRVLDGITTPGMLVCDGCKGGRYRGTCHAVTTAERALRANGQSMAEWIAPAPMASGY